MTAYRLVPLAALGVAASLLAGSARGDDPLPAKVELNVGDRAPAFVARTDADTTWESSGSVGKKWVVVYFYPGDFTFV